MPYAIIRRAIERRQSLTGEYETFSRLFSPHALGEDRAGVQAVLGFQYGGERRGGLPVGGDWCFFLLPFLTTWPNFDEWFGGPLGKPLHLFGKIDAQV